MESILSRVFAVQVAHAIEALTRGRNGETVVARVEAMLSIGLARLSINHQQIDVTTPVELVVGSEINLALDSHKGTLRLILQKDGQSAIVQRAIGAPTDELGGDFGGPLLAARDRIAAISISGLHEIGHQTIVAQAYAAEGDQINASLIERASATDRSQGTITTPVANSTVSAAAIAAAYISKGFPGTPNDPADEILADNRPDHDGDKHKEKTLCHCTSGKESYALLDARSLFSAYVCEDCEAAFKARFPAEYFEAPSKQKTISSEVV